MSGHRSIVRSLAEGSECNMRRDLAVFESRCPDRRESHHFFRWLITLDTDNGMLSAQGDPSVPHTSDRVYSVMDS